MRRPFTFLVISAWVGGPAYDIGMLFAPGLAFLIGLYLGAFLELV